MECKIDGCSNTVMYVERQICQKHYFRFMRKGSYDLSRKAKYRISNPAGYMSIHEPHHKLADNRGYVYEHRFVYHNEVNSDPKECLLCGDSINWDTCHIDHIDEDITNNKKENLRALCRPCNTFRGYTEESNVKHLFEIDGRKMSAFAWARQDDVVVAGATILRRRLKYNMSDYDCVYSPRKTHQNMKTKVGKDKRKYDDVRGI